MDYESDVAVSEYLLMHYGSDEERMPWSVGRMSAIDFPAVTVNYFTQRRVDLSLDLGCSVGGSSFHLSRTSKKVIGIDLSEKFVQAANAMKAKGSLSYKYQVEGDVLADGVASLGDGVKSDVVSFAVGDVLKLPEGFKDFDRVHASNLLCRVPDPEKLLKRFSTLLKKDGELVLSTPFSWLEKYTPKENWPAGDSWTWLQNHLSKDFVCLQHADEVFTMRQHVRKFQLGVAHVSKWRRKESFYATKRSRTRERST